MKNQFFVGVALFALVAPGLAHAQSTGTIAAEDENENVTVVTGASTSKGIDGIQIPDSPKARSIVGQDFLSQQTPGQSILQSLNVVPSLNFTNNDPYGSSGGNVRLRGFDGPRIAFTFDGMPLNDTGNYALYSNQTLDPELVSEVNVNYGTTDVDSATASAAGGTINYRSMTPTKEFGAILTPTIGRFQYRRVFGMINTGEFTKWGTRAYIAASRADNNKFKGPGYIQKRQYNARIYQPLGGNNGDFFAITGHYNRNRNNFIRAITQQQVHDYYKLGDRREYDYSPNCKRLTPTAGGVDNEATGITTVNGKTVQTITQTYQTIPGTTEVNCSNYYNTRVNPSNTWNVHGNLKYTISDKITFTLDPSYQYVLANGGGYTNAAENSAQTRGANLASKGVDLNGDGDTLDTVSLYTPNTTNTHRWVVLSSLRYDINDKNYVRLAYAFDRGWHRQTGQAGFYDANGTPYSWFGGRNGDGPKDATGTDLRTRDRRSIAMLNQISGEYRGFFFDRRLELQLGLRAPWFTRKLKQNCYTLYGSAPSGTLNNSGQYCSTQPESTLKILQPGEIPPAGASFTGYAYAPYSRTVKWHRVLPNVGGTFKIREDLSVYGSFSRGLSVPRTDNLYRTPTMKVKPETVSNLDFGVRYLSPKIQVSIGGFGNWFKNRIVSSYDQDTGLTFDRNVGRVHSKGFEVSVNLRPVRWFSINNSLSYLDAKYRDSLLLTPATATAPAVYAELRGRRVVETPKWQIATAPTFKYKGAELGFLVKWSAKRYATDINDMAVAGYTMVDLNARYDLKELGLKDTFIQLNVMNLFNKHSVGSINSATVATGIYDGTQHVSGLQLGQKIPSYSSTSPTMYVGNPRAISVSLHFGF